MAIKTINSNVGYSFMIQ